MAAELFGKANEEFISENYEAATKLYTEALDLEKRDDIYSNRAQALLKLEQYKDALEDCKEAVKLNPNNVKAYLRQGTALFHLEDYSSAKSAFHKGLGLSGDDNNFKTWIRKCDAELNLQEQNKTGSSSVGVSQGQQTTNGTAQSSEQTTQSSSTAAPPAPVVKKYDWYQTNTHVVLTVLYKNCKEEDVKVDIQERSLGIDIKLPNAANFTLDISHLSHPIDVDKSSYKVLKSKVEINLKKTEGIMWKKLEGEEEEAPKVAANSAATAYPTSSHYTRNWDKLAKEVDEEEKDEKKEGDAALNDLFKKIYADGSDEQKKAMVKSFYESGGTVLSTNWEDIGKKKTEVKPPDGMEYKKWEQ